MPDALLLTVTPRVLTCRCADCDGKGWRWAAPGQHPNDPEPPSRSRRYQADCEACDAQGFVEVEAE